MASFLPIKLVGDSLGKRHQHFNQLVNEAYKQGISLSSVRDLPEKSPLDRLFKIDLASKYKDVDYIIENLKHEDLLYVSGALKCMWMVDEKFRNIINPTYLEDNLYAEMTTVAVTKMKHWIEINLKDSQRCEEFYQYYSGKHFDVAIKFLPKCNADFILEEVANAKILEQIRPHHLKLLIEKCPEVAKVCFDSLESNAKLLENYLDDELKYYETTKFVLKANGDIFLDITEKYFSVHSFSRFSAEATKYVMTFYKERFNKKPELYTAWFLDIDTLAKCLTTEEIKELILKLARAEYLQYFFNKAVEPLIKRLSREERTAFKKQVFVDKNFGEKVEIWPYKTPSSPEIKATGSSIFKDKEHEPYEYDYMEDTVEMVAECDGFKRMLKKRKAKHYACDVICTRKSSLDELFDRYRFMSFEKTMQALQKQIRVETLQHRQNIMLVLISKSGGRVDSLEQLLNFLTARHSNEPENLRATVIRSLVRRCNVWRLPQNLWDLVLNFGRGIGLDGRPSTVACKEGLHAVVIRDVLLDQEIDSTVWKTFMEDFSTFKEYTLNSSEKKKIALKLPEILVAASKQEPADAVDRLGKALDTLDEYKMRIENFPNIIKVIAAIAKNDKSATTLLQRLFSARVARRELFKENFAIIQNNASYLNALKHDVTVISTGVSFKALINMNELAHDGFIKSLALYFNEENGLARKYLELLKEYINTEEKSKKKLARYIAILSSEDLVRMMDEFTKAPKKSSSRSFAAALRANCHLARPLINLNELEWKSIGVKAVANRVLKCCKKHVELNIQVLLTWSRTQKLALILSMRVGKEMSLVSIIGEKRPQLTIKTILKHSKRNKLDEGVWNIITPVISTYLTTTAVNDRLANALSNVELIPVNKRGNYCMTVFEVFKKVSRYANVPMLCYMERILSEMDQTFFEGVIKKFLEEEFTSEKLSSKSYSYDIFVCLYFRIIAKYLLLSESDIEQKQKWEKVGKPFFDCLDQVSKNREKKSDLLEYLDDFLLSLKYSKVFLDTKYACCLPMFKLIINRLQMIFPLHECYDKYIRLHLTMLYYKSVRQGIKNNPSVFEDLPKNLNYAAEIVGRIFGKLIANEVIQLIESYFESVRDIYKRELKEYLNSYFEYGESRTILGINMVRSILEHENGKVHLLAEYIYDDQGHDWPEEVKEEISAALKESKNMEVRFFFYYHANPW